MRTTVRLDPDLLARAKALAARTGRTLTAVIEDALRAAISGAVKRRGRARIELPTSGRGGLQEGVDLDKSAALRERMDSDDAPR